VRGVNTAPIQSIPHSIHRIALFVVMGGVQIAVIIIIGMGIIAAAEIIRCVGGTHTASQLLPAHLIRCVGAQNTGRLGIAQGVCACVDIIIIAVGVIEVQLQRDVVNCWTKGLATCRRRSPATIVVHIFCPNSTIGRGLPACPYKPKPEGTLSNDQFNPFQLNRHPLSSMKNEKSLHFPFNNIFHAFTFCVRKNAHTKSNNLWVTEQQLPLK
jgi:hypothetical protein